MAPSPSTNHGMKREGTMRELMELYGGQIAGAISGWDRAAAANHPVVSPACSAVHTSIPEMGTSGPPLGKGRRGGCAEGGHAGRA